MFKKSILAMLTIAAAGAATPAAAADNNFYGVASGGRSTIDADAAAINAFALRSGVTTATSNSSNDVGWKLQLGYQMTPTWALEGGYASLGQAKYIVTAAAPAAYTASGTRKADLFNLDLVGRVEINKGFYALGRLGGYYWRTDSDLPFAAGLNKTRDTGTDVKIGAGLQYDFTRNFALRGEFERYNGIGKSSTSGDSKVNLLSIGAVLKFQ
jgi:opacity protein-like surface antigen